MFIKVESCTPVPCDFAFAWYMHPGAFRRLLPPWVRADFISLSSKAQIGLKMYWGPFFFTWILEREYLKTNQECSDKQIKGPFSSYLHVHRFTPINPKSCMLSDEVEFSTFSFLERRMHNQLLRVLHWCQETAKEDLKLLYKHSRTPLKILVSGTNGFIGSMLKVFLQLAGHTVMRLVRYKDQVASDTVYWDPINGQFSKQEFEGFDAVFHLAGASLAHRWTKRYRKKLFDSRCRDSWLLSQMLSRLYCPPKTVISASAVGYYGDCETRVTELSPKGKGFLSLLCHGWESAWETLEERGSRVIYARFGVVLGAKGGMLRQIVPIYRLGLGGKIGLGNQYLSWIGIDDAIGALYHILMTEGVDRAVNLVAPHPVKQKEFSSILANKLHRTHFCRLPASLISFFLGDMGKEVLLASSQVYPQKLLESGYSFRHSHIQEALDWVL